jgi:peroxiredoxin family protein
MTAPVAEPETITRDTGVEHDLLGFLESAVSEAPIETILPRVEPETEAETPVKQLVIINWSGDFDRVLPTLILADAAAAMGYKTKVFTTFWGLLPFVKDQKRIIGENWMQKMLAFMQRPGISHLKTTKLNMFGMGPWMFGRLMKKYNVASAKEMLEVALALDVEFMPCQMTMDMFGLKRDDFIDGLGEPVGAATVLELMTQPNTASLFI